MEIFWGDTPATKKLATDSTPEEYSQIKEGRESTKEKGQIQKAKKNGGYSCIFICICMRLSMLVLEKCAEDVTHTATAKNSNW